MFTKFLQSRKQLTAFTRLRKANLTTNTLDNAKQTAVNVKTAEKPNQSSAGQAAKPLVKNRFGKNLIKITSFYMLIIVVGITTFYLAKKDVNENRVETMKIKKEIASIAASPESSKAYPNRFELYKAEK